MDEHKRYIIALLTLLIAFVSLFGIILFSAIRKFAERKKKMVLHEQLMESHFREELLRSVLEMQEHTFQSVSRDIHDNVGQLLSLAKLNLNILSLEHTANDKLLAIKDLIGSAIGELRNLGTAYHADSIINTGLIAAITYQVEQLKRTGMFTVAYHSDIESLPLSKSATILLYRVMQESFNNIIRHSGASDIQVTIKEDKDRIYIIIADNGKGFNRNDPAFQYGIGLNSMQQRVLMSGATLKIESGEGKGTTVTLIINNTK